MSITAFGRRMSAIISTVVFNRKDCDNNAESDLLEIAKFVVTIFFDQLVWYLDRNVMTL